MFPTVFAPVPLLRHAGAALLVAALCVPAAALADESRLVLHSADGEHVFHVDVVDTPESRAQGLMFVTELADDAGMLFDFKEERPVSFWMMNTFIPLDMLFIDAEGVVRTVHVNARPHDTTSIPSQVPVQYVLEIPGGVSARLGIKPGDTVAHERIGLADR